MNYEQALEASKHNPAGVVKVLERLDVECPRCAGTGIKCYVCGGEKKIKWSWIPQVGEWVIHKQNIYLVASHIVPKEGEVWVNDPHMSATVAKKVSECTPILSWETIEEILEKAGYNLIGLDRGESKKFHCDIMRKNSLVVATIGKSRQEAVMRAVDALGKEL